MSLSRGWGKTMGMIIKVACLDGLNDQNISIRNSEEAV